MTGPAINVGDDTGGTPTSTSTVLGEDATGDVLLRMFGVSPGQLSALGPGLEGSAPIDCGEVEQGLANIGYIESTSAPPSSATAAELRFEPEASPAPITLTVVPRLKSGLTLENGDGDAEPAYVVYKDPHVLELPDELGWLMCLARYHHRLTEGAFGEGTVTNAGPTNTMAAVVGFWAPASDPTFTGNGVKGPFWLVGRWHNVDGVRTPLWLGVPSAAVVEQAGVEYLNVYYTAESTDYALGGAAEASPSVRGTYLRRIRLDALLVLLAAATADPGEDASGLNLTLTWLRASLFIRSARARGEIISAGLARGLSSTVIHRDLARVTLATATSADATQERRNSFTAEEEWDSAAGAWLLTGVEAGKVRIWVATGREFVSGADPASISQGNTLIEDEYVGLKVVDAVPVVDGGDLVLFFSGNVVAGEAVVGVNYWGIWRAIALDPSIGDFGLDFVVDDDLSDQILASSSETTSEAGKKLDPDPVRLPDGTWVVFAGEANAALVRLEGEHDDVFTSAGEAWR